MSAKPPRRVSSTLLCALFGYTFIAVVPGSAQTNSNANMMYDVGLHVPFIVSMPGGARGAVVDTPVELIDLYPTIVDSLGLPVPPEVQGTSLANAVRDAGPVPEKAYVFSENSSVKMLRSRTHKLVYYPGQPYGELYDLVKDPEEITNLYDDPAHAEQRTQMTKALLDRLVFAEAPLHGASLRGPAYWRYSYHKAFDSSVHPLPAPASNESRSA